MTSSIGLRRAAAFVKGASYADIARNEGRSPSAIASSIDHFVRMRLREIGQDENAPLPPDTERVERWAAGQVPTGELGRGWLRRNVPRTYLVGPVTRRLVSYVLAAPAICPCCGRPL